MMFNSWIDGKVQYFYFADNYDFTKHDVSVSIPEMVILSVSIWIIC